MNIREIPLFVQLLLPFTLLAIGIGIAAWLSPIPDAELTAAQSNLLDFADWVMKMSAGAIIALGSSARIRAIGGNGTAKQSPQG